MDDEMRLNWEIKSEDGKEPRKRTTLHLQANRHVFVRKDEACVYECLH